MNNFADKQVVVFQVGNDKFALDILSIREIARYQPVRKIPRAPEFLSGVIDLRGEEIIPVIDLHDRLDLPSVVPLEKSRIIVAPIDRQFVGFRVDIVRDVLNVAASQLEPPPAVGSAPDFLEAVIRIKEKTKTEKNEHLVDEIILLLNIKNILSSDEKLKISEIRSRLNQPETTAATANTNTNHAPSASPTPALSKKAKPTSKTKKSS